MASCQQNVLNNKGLKKQELFIFTAVSILGIIFGIIFLIYYTIIKYNLLYTGISIIYFLIGVGFIIYVEGQIRKKERDKQRY